MDRARPQPAALHEHDEPSRTRGPARPLTKTSIGVILCRTNTATGRPEVLLVHKRYTYAFSEFVHGRYIHGRTSPAATMRAVAALLNDMTTEELLDVMSLNFEQMWYRVWLTHEKRDLYNRKYSKFVSTFMREDGGESLLQAVRQARGNGVLLWEVPKGRRQSAREADILCAVRELREEAGVEKNEYRLLPGVRRRVSYTSSGTRYVCIYYVALANPRLARAAKGFNQGRPALRDITLMGEVSDVRWHDVEQIRLLEWPNTRLEDLVSPAFRLIKQYVKGRWASRRPPASVSSAPIVIEDAKMSEMTEMTETQLQSLQQLPQAPQPSLASSGGWRVARRRGGRQQGNVLEPPKASRGPDRDDYERGYQEVNHQKGAKGTAKRAKEQRKPGSHE
jgi:8-oxo-dGTP pyrophosphatase MutT (NUDIX family)